MVAAGDVARWYNPRFEVSMRVEHWTNAVEQANHAAQRLLEGDGTHAPFAPVPFVWSDQYDRKIQSTGQFGPDDDLRIVHGSLDERRFVALYGREDRITGVLGFSRPRLVMKYRRMMRDGIGFAEAIEENA